MSTMTIFEGERRMKHIIRIGWYNQADGREIDYDYITVIDLKEKCKFDIISVFAYEGAHRFIEDYKDYEFDIIYTDCDDEQIINLDKKAEYIFRIDKKEYILTLAEFERVILRNRQCYAESVLEYDNWTMYAQFDGSYDALDYYNGKRKRGIYDEEEQ